MKIRQDGNGETGNIGMVCFETKEQANTALQELKEQERYTVKEYKTRQSKESTENAQHPPKDIQKTAESPYQPNNNIEGVDNSKRNKQCYSCNSDDHQIKDCQRKTNILVRHRENRIITEEEMNEIMAQYGEVKRIKSREENYTSIYHESMMVCFATEEEAERAIHEVKQQDKWDAQHYQKRRTERNRTNSEIQTNKNIEH